LTLFSITAASEGNYSVQVSGVCNSVTNSATLQVNVPTTADALVSQTNCPGETVSFSTMGRGTGPFTYQWVKDGTSLSGQTDDSLTLAGSAAASGGTYSVRVTGVCKSATNAATLTVNQNVVVAVAPVSVTNCPGTSASFSVTASGTGPFTYQWSKDGNALS